MNRITYFFVLLSFISLRMNASSEDSLLVITEAELAMRSYIDSLERTFHYQTGDIIIGDNLATLTVPEGFKFLDAEQSSRVLTEMWGNPPSDVLGMLFPENISPISDNFTYAVEISYSEEGYIDDDDAKKVDYEELMEEMQKDIVQENKERERQGYSTYQLVGWASQPFYDEGSKKLHWAKELKFTGTDINTLNYNIRVLGRKGYLNLNAIGDITILPLVQHDVDKVLASVDFNDGYKYSDFNPDIDEVAAYGIGGLVAGKVLAKTGFLAILAKFGKFIIIGVVGIFAALRKRLFGSSAEGKA